MSEMQACAHVSVLFNAYKFSNTSGQLDGVICAKAEIDMISVCFLPRLGVRSKSSFQVGFIDFCDNNMLSRPSKLLAQGV